MDGLSGVIVFVWLFGLVLLMAWVALPFAMFGIKPLLRELITLTKESNRLLKEGTPRQAPSSWTSPDK